MLFCFGDFFFFFFLSFLLCRFTPHQLEAFKKEMRIWSRLYHPNICLFMGAYVSPEKVLIVTEILEGDLETLLKKNKKLSLYTRMKMAKEAAQGIAWLHGQNPKVVHRDIKTSNFLYDRNFRIKVCDFGLSDLAERNIQDLSGAKGTLLYMAPEVMMGAPFNEKADVYSFGIVLWEVLTFTEPFPHHTNVPGFVKAVAHDGERPVIPAGTPLSLASLMQDCWKAQYDQRPTFIEICDRLDIVVIDAAIRDAQGNAFWKRAFFKQERVPFDDFSRTFYQFLGMEKPEEVTVDEANMSGYVTSDFMFDSDAAGLGDEGQQQLMDLSQSKGNLQNGGGGGGVGGGVGVGSTSTPNNNTNLPLTGLKLLRALMASETMNPHEAMVHIFTFGKVLDSLGPLDATFMHRMLELCSQKWFFGGISTEAAVKTLLNEPRGAFLVRFCNHPNLPGYFVISKVTRTGKVIHIRIKHFPGAGFSIEGTDQEFSTLRSLVETSQYLHLEPEKAANHSKFWHIVSQASQNQPVVGYLNFGPDEPYAMDLEDE